MTTRDADARLARDAMHRAQALDPGRSFLVQAPAGSGKTELLIQRYLALLAIVERPERVVAMTFTRKAASEMRERVIAALRDAEGAPAPTDAHHAKTRELAIAALRRDRDRGWALLAHPARLAIFTIDALCATVARAAPITTGLGATPRVEQQAGPLHREAARAALAAATAGDASWRVVLAHLDNDADRVVELLASMLGRREQWLRRVGQPDAAALRRELERVLHLEIEGELKLAHMAFPVPLRAALVRVAAYAASNLRHEAAGAELAATLELCASTDGLPPPAPAYVDHWRRLASWLLLADKPRMRKSMNKNAGIPAKGSGAGAADRAARKDEVEALLEALADTAGIGDALDAARNLPPSIYGEENWAMVAALLDILPRVAAQLLVTFAARGVIDFAQQTLAALAALGTPDAPSDLLLRLDLKVEHLLIDEFQDTSDAQFALLARLTAGWSQGDGRTLFAVGDPMQSIYRFREAEVRLFLDAQAKARICDVPVQFIDLARNFRSQGLLVAWVNRVFPSVLAPRNDPWRGAVAFAPAVPARDDGSDGAPTIDIVANPEAEARQVVMRVRNALAADAGDVAILVRARAALEAILPALRRAGIDFAALDLDPLGARQAILDLASLAHALVQPADRMAALSVLRAPWCGLALADLLAVAPQLDPGLPRLFERRAEIAGISDDGRRRLDRLARTLAPSFAEHGRVPIADRVRGAWLALGGPATIDEGIDLDAAEDFFALLRAHTAAGDIRDWNALVDALGELRATPAAGDAARVKVMTLHRAKGLEFDTVIMPGMSRVHDRSEAGLLRWRTRPQGILLASIGARAGDGDPVYGYLTRLAAVEADHELGRLLYVGATRARRRLHLVATADFVEPPDGGPRAWKAPASRSALAKLWDAIAGELASPDAAAAGDATANGGIGPEAEAAGACEFRRSDPPDGELVTARAAPMLRRLPADFAMPLLPAAARAPLPAMRAAPATLTFDWAHATSAAIGTVTHRLLAQREKSGGAAFPGREFQRLRARIRRDLVGEGVDAAELDAAAADVENALRRVAEDERGRWLFAPTHSDAASEWALAGVDGGSLVHVTLDRTFVADGVRWIVDFKTGRHAGGNPDAFLAREVERYRPQLERYARIVRALDTRPFPIRLALYYPLVEGGWREWLFEPRGERAGESELR